jgi:acetolactate synthase-1/2/3 large subunit
VPGLGIIPAVNGAESLIRTARAAGIELCLANPGTTEMHLVQALEDVGGVRCVLGLFEGVCSGAADGYARMTGRPALVLLHLGPGLGNAVANLHNAAKARTPVFVVVGDHATAHRGRGAPLEADVEGLARPVSRWVRTARSAATVAADAAEAIAAATSAPGRVATLIVPADCAWEEAATPAEPRPANAPVSVDEDAVRQAARVLSAAAPTHGRDGTAPAALLLGGDALSEPGVRAAGRVAAETGCALFAETFPARVERGRGLPPLRRLPYFPEDATAALAPASGLVLAGTHAPVAFFAYPGLPSEIAPPGTPVHALALPGEDAVGALERLADRLGGTHRLPGAEPPVAPPAGPLSPETVGAVVAVAQPEGAIMVDEAITLSEPYVRASAGAPRHSYLALTGGAIGDGLPVAVGAALACPDRPVLVMQADGSGMYTPQSLWTMAREGLDVTVVVLANGTYRILQVELARAGVATPGPTASALTDLGGPRLDWVALAAGMGVPGVSAATTDGLADALARALAEPGPHLIEAVVA